MVGTRKGLPKKFTRGQGRLRLTVYSKVVGPIGGVGLIENLGLGPAARSEYELPA